MDKIMGYVARFQLNYAPRLYRLVVVSILISLFLGDITSAQGAAAAVARIAGPIKTIICNLFCVFVDVAGALAALVFVASAVMWIASRDDPAKRKQAKVIMIHAILGLVLVGITNQIMSSLRQSDKSGIMQAVCAQADCAKKAVK